MSTEEPSKVCISGINIPFIDLVVFLIKLAVASIPAIIVLLILLHGINILIGGIPLLKPPKSKEGAETIMIIVGLISVFFFFAYRKSK